MTSILRQRGGDPVRARLRGGEVGAGRIGILAAARVADRRDMVDVDPEAEMGGHRTSVQAAWRLPGFSAGMAASSGGKASGA